MFLISYRIELNKLKSQCGAFEKTSETVTIIKSEKDVGSGVISPITNFEAKQSFQSFAEVNVVL